jgi:nitroreductase
MSEVNLATPPHPLDGLQRDVEVSAIDAVRGRKSVRRFLPAAVPREMLIELLAEAARAPSGTNFQPWKVHVATGAARKRLSEAVIAAAEAGKRSNEYAYAPNPVPEPYLTRRRQVGYELYRLYGVEKHDYPARKRAMLRNFEFFGAPVGLFFTMERRMMMGSWLDCGMFMQTVMILARARGLDTCPQQAWCEYGSCVHDALGIPDDEIILSGMALGFADPDAPENGLKSERIPPSKFTRFHDD